MKSLNINQFPNNEKLEIIIKEIIERNEQACTGYLGCGAHGKNGGCGLVS